jgi:hypothetical protein
VDRLRVKEAKVVEEHRGVGRGGHVRAAGLDWALRLQVASDRKEYSVALLLLPVRPPEVQPLRRERGQHLLVQALRIDRICDVESA